VTLERRRPLPPGRYWAYIYPQNRAEWDAWITVQRKEGHAAIEWSEHFDPVGDSPSHDFVIWTTSDETVWPDELLGFIPNVAGPEITSSQSTMQRPPADETDPLGKIEDIGRQIGNTIVTVGSVAIGVVALVAILSLTRKGR
jgi:hypothetical protein